MSSWQQQSTTSMASNYHPDADTSSPPEFKRDAVELVRTSGRPIAEIARDLGIWDSTLGNWARQARIDAGEQDGLSSDERARLGVG